MSKKALSINFPVQRVVLSDILPYEIPIVFSNRNFYKFLCEYSVVISENKLSWNSNNEVLDCLVKMLFGFDQSVPTSKTIIENAPVSTINLVKGDLPTIPFVFSTTHKQDQLRQLSVMHPKAQLQVVEFYNEFQDLIIYYCGRSSFSLRSPTRVAGCTFIDARAQIELVDKSDTLVEVEGENYENLRSFFVYEKFSNVFKFFESRQHLNSERDFKYLTKLDISSCFDSIYTHSIAWAIYGKDFSKRNLKTMPSSFPGKFDSLMQRLNFNETNGILIGPEVSRIFAEIILQAIDSDVCDALSFQGIFHLQDFRIFRYVDDFFVFYNKEDVYNKFRFTLQESLKLYKLSLNKGKEETLCRPIITPISIAKKRISDLFNRVLVYEIALSLRDGEELHRGEIYIGKSSLITEFKSILSISGVGYGDILNYSLSIVERKIGSIFKDYGRIQKISSSEKNLTDSILALLGFVFFIYSVSPKVNTTIKLCRICQRILAYYKKNLIGLHYGATVSQVIYERCRSVMHSTSDGESAKIEVMYLLVLISQLGSNYRVDEITLGKYFGFAFNGAIFTTRQNLNYFSIVTLLFYIQNKKRYTNLKVALEECIIEKFEVKKDALIGDSELIHLAMDLLACPYLNREFKNRILIYYGIASSYLSRLQNYSPNWFTNWGEFNFSKELDAKVSREVY